MCSGLTILVINKMSSKIMLIRLDGKVKGSMEEITIPTKHNPKIIQSCFNNFICKSPIYKSGIVISGFHIAS